MEYLFIYLLQVLDLLKVVNGISWFILIVLGATFILTICYCSDNCINLLDKEDEETKDAMKLLGILKKVAIVIGVVIISVSVIPTKQTLLLMGGTYMAKKTVSSIATDSRMSKVNAIIDLQLDKCLKDLKQEVR